MYEAEKEAIAKTALKAKAHPRDTDVRHLHECCPMKVQIAAPSMSHLHPSLNT